MKRKIRFNKKRLFPIPHTPSVWEISTIRNFDTKMESDTRITLPLWGEHQSYPPENIYADNPELKSMLNNTINFVDGRGYTSASVHLDQYAYCKEDHRYIPLYVFITDSEDDLSVVTKLHPDISKVNKDYQHIIKEYFKHALEIHSETGFVFHIVGLNNYRFFTYRYGNEYALRKVISLIPITLKDINTISEYFNTQISINARRENKRIYNFDSIADYPRLI